MRILRIIYDWPPPWQGLAPHPYEISVAQIKAGHEVDVFCGRWPSAGPIEIPKGLKVHPIIRELLPNTIFFTSSVLLLIQYIMWRKLHKVDIIHSHGHFGIWIYYYRNFLKKHFPWAEELKTPLVVHFHNTAQGRWNTLEEKNQSIKTDSKMVGWPMAVMSDKAAIEAAAACIFVSEQNRKEAIELYSANPDRCFVVETGVNTDLFIPASAEEKEKSRKDLGLDIYDKVILNLGYMVERKNVHLIIEALALLPNVYKLLLVGDGDSSYIGKINETMKLKKVESRVIRVGYTPYPQTPIAYQQADLFVLPSVFEGFPKVVMESLGCGTPVLASGFKAANELDGLYYLDNLDPAYIAKRILELVENPKQLDNTNLVLNYSWASRVKQIEKVYEFAKENYL